MRTMGTRTLDAQKESACQRKLIVSPGSREGRAPGATLAPGRSTLCEKDGVIVLGHRWAYMTTPRGPSLELRCKRCAEFVVVR